MLNTHENDSTMFCSQFENVLIDYLDDTLDKKTRRAASEHALRCPLCHALLSEVKTTVAACQHAQIAAPSPALDARIINLTMPESAMSCGEFEDLLTDYLDGFLPANLFHRWERHAVLCQNCTDLPGEVVRSIGACYTYKAEELLVPANLQQRILESTLGTAEAETVKMPVWANVRQQLENIFQPIFTPIFTAQFASVAMFLLMAFVIFSNANPADASISGVYQTGAQMAAQTYEQTHDAVETGIAKGLDFNQQPATGEPAKGVND